MKLAHYVRIRVLCKDNENPKIIEKVFRKLIPFNLEEQKLKLEINTVKGVKENNITIMQVELKKDSHSSKFIKFISKSLSSDQKNLLINELDTRIDDKNHIYIRLDKEKLLNNEFIITDNGNCFHITICLACYPSTKENAIKLAKNVFS